MKIIYLVILLFSNAKGDIYVDDMEKNVTVAKMPSESASFGQTFLPETRAYLVKAEPLLACSKIKPPPTNLSSEIRFVALIKRGNCTFDTKVLAAQQSSYSGAIIYNNENDAIFHMRASKYANMINIPSVMVGLTYGRQLKQLYTVQVSSLRYTLVFDNFTFNPEIYIIAFLGFVSFGFFIIGIGFAVKVCRDLLKRRANRLRKCHLKKIPIKKFVKGDSLYETCAICLEDYNDGDKLRILPCNHAYHSMCIDPWLLKQRRNCPICKFRIFIPGINDPEENAQSENVHSQVGEQGIASGSGVQNPNLENDENNDNNEVDPCVTVVQPHNFSTNEKTPLIVVDNFPKYSSMNETSKSPSVNKGILPSSSSGGYYNPCMVINESDKCGSKPTETNKDQTKGKKGPKNVSINNYSEDIIYPPNSTNICSVDVENTAENGSNDDVSKDCSTPDLNPKRI